MVGRALAFSSSETIALTRARFVPVIGDEWYYRRREDPEGAFFNAVADQGPRKKGKGGTRQGIYLFTAGGKLLGYAPGDVLPETLQSTLRTALAAWERLPEVERKPGAASIPASVQADPRYNPAPPPGALIVKVHSRILDRDPGGKACSVGGDVAIDERRIPPLAQYDRLWLRESEWRSLVPARPREGQVSAVPAEVALRILRFHLVDNTRGEPEPWALEDVRSSSLTLTVEQASSAGVRLRLDGAALLVRRAGPESAERGFAVRLLGYLHHDTARRKLDRFDVVALGDHWGDGPYTSGSRPGRTALGIAFTLTSGASPVDRIPPHAARELDSYFSAASPPVKRERPRR